MVKKQINNKVVSLKEKQLQNIMFNVYLPEREDTDNTMMNASYIIDKNVSEFKNMDCFGGDKYAMHSI